MFFNFFFSIQGEENNFKKARDNFIALGFFPLYSYTIT